MTKSPLTGFFLVEDYDKDEPVERDVHGDDLALPVRDRRPIDPGFVLTWQECPADGGPPAERRGIVLTPAPPAKSVWVIPDDPRPDEGYVVLVREVSAAGGAAGAYRCVGDAGDYASSADWQSPRSLPRAWLRVDTMHCGGDSPDRPVAYLHARTDCQWPPPAPFMEITVTRGEPVRVEDCYVYDGYLHPASIHPRVPAGTREYDPYARPCEDCLKSGTPA